MARQLTKASQAEAEAGLDNSKFMTPALVAAAIAALAGEGGASLNQNYSVKTNTASNLTTGEQETGLQVTITPTSNTSKILVFGQASIAGNGYGILQLKDDTVYLQRGDTAGSRDRALSYIFPGSWGTFPMPVFFQGVYVPGVTTLRTIKLIWHKLSGDDLYLNRTRSDIDASGYPRTSSVIYAVEIP